MIEEPIGPCSLPNIEATFGRVFIRVYSFRFNKTLLILFAHGVLAGGPNDVANFGPTPEGTPIALSVNPKSTGLGFWMPPFSLSMGLL